jgi:hypothetical protein
VKQPVAIFIGGTFATSLFGKLFYHRVAKLFGRAHVITIPGCGLLAIDQAAELVTAEIAKWVPAGTPIVLGGHSQGALIAAHYALDHPEVVRVVALNAPFDGTCRAYLGYPLMASMRDMAPGSAYLTRLNARLPEIAGRLATVAFADDMLVPWQSSYVPGATNYLCSDEATFHRARAAGLELEWVPQHGRWIGHISGMLVLNGEVPGLLARTLQYSQETLAA